jgi:hypothetical protein
MSINFQTDNVECDVCHADCDETNDDGVGGYDRSGHWRDLCPDCARKFHLDYCANCHRLFPADQLDPECFECPECNVADNQTKMEIYRRVEGIV